MAEESTNKVEPEDDAEKAHPIERITITRGPPKVPSRYLGGPRSSCHDLCKYGIQHAAAEAKPWTRATKVLAKRDKKTKGQEENATSLAGTKKSGSNSKLSPAAKIGDSNSNVDIKEIVHQKTVDSEKNSPHFEKTDVSIENNDSGLRQAQHSEASPLPVKESSKSEIKRKTVKSKSGFGSSSIKQTRPSFIVDKERSMPKSSPLSPKHKVKKTSSLSANKTAKDFSIVSSLKDNENVDKDSTNLSEEPTRSPSRKISLKQTSKKTGNSALSASSRKGLRHVGKGTHSSISGSLSSSGSKGKKVPSVSRSTSISSSSSITSHGKRSTSMSSSSSITLHGKHNGAATSKLNKTRIGCQGEKVKVGYKVKPRMGTIVGAANKVATPARKLTFRRGRVIEIQPQVNNIPRRLKFKRRPAPPLGDDILRDINAARKRAIASKEQDASESSSANAKQEKVVPRSPSSEGGKKRIIVGKNVDGDRSKTDGSKQAVSDEKVVLRHQNVEGKKVNPRLYNNVIEETASMLAELRKSKVKALVSAFETVISLDSPRESIAPVELTTPC